MPSTYASVLISASVVRVWDTVRDFNGLPSWHPFVKESRIEGGARADQVGCIRAFRLEDGGFIREKLLSLSDIDRSLTYSILESPMDLSDYTATLGLMPVTDANATFVEWKADFSCSAEKEKPLVRQIEQGVFQQGLASLKQRFGS